MYLLRTWDNVEGCFSSVQAAQKYKKISGSKGAIESVKIISGSDNEAIARKLSYRDLCPSYSKYKGVRRPSCGCKSCWVLYIEQNEGKW